MVFPGNGVIFGDKILASSGNSGNSTSYFESDSIRSEEDYFSNKYFASAQTIELATDDQGGSDDGGGFLGIIEKLQDLWDMLMGLRSWLEDSNRENSERLADFFNIDTQLRESYHIGNNDGTMSLLLKGQITRLSDNINEYLNDYLGIDSTFYDVASISSEDGLFSRLIKGQITRIVGAVDTPAFVSIFMGVDSSFYTTGNISNDDGLFTRLIKAQTTRIVNAVNSPEFLDGFFGVDSSFYNTGNYSSDDGIFTEFLKGQSTRIVNAVNSPGFVFDFFAVDSSFYNTGNYSSDDGIFTEFLKGQSNRIVNAVNSPSFATNLFAVDSSFYNTGNISNDDGMFTRLLKAQTTRIVNAIAGGVGGGDNSEVVDLLEDIKNAIEKLESTPAGATIWDFLTELVTGITSVLDGILDFLNNLLDFLRDAIIPSDTEFISEWFDNISSDIDAKFAVIDDLRITLTTAFQVEEREFEDKYIQIDILGTSKEIKLFDGEYLNIAVPYVRKFLSAIMILLTMIFAYQKITGRGGVIE